MLKLHAVGSQIASRRKALGLSQSLLAHKAGVSRATLDALENGRSVPLPRKAFSRGAKEIVTLCRLS